MKILATWKTRILGKPTDAAPHIRFGRDGEKVALRYLKRKGYKIIEKNADVGRGEIDIVALDGDVIVFVEVKSRHSSKDGHPADFVTPAKQRQLTRLALLYLSQHRWSEEPARFDVVVVTWEEDGGKPLVEHFVDAFEATGLDGMYS